jgi:hypothetical protein
MGIADLVGECMAAMPHGPAASLDAVLAADAAARAWCTDRLGRSAVLRA